MEIKYSAKAEQGMRAQMNVARDVLEAKRMREQQTVQLRARQVRRLRARQAARQQKKATRTYVRRQWAADREEQNLLGLARVYSGFVDATPAMRRNVDRHLRGIELGLVEHMRSDDPAEWVDDLELMGLAYDQISRRLNGVLEKAHTEAVATAEDMTYADTRGRTFVSVVKR